MKRSVIKTLALTLCMLLMLQLGAAAATTTQKTTAFSLSKLQSNAKSLKEDLRLNKLYESKLTAISNELVRLNNEYAKGIKVKDPKTLVTTLSDIDKTINGINLKSAKLKVYAKATDKRTVANITDTQKKIDKIKSSLAKAQKNYGAGNAKTSSDNWAKVYYDFLLKFEYLENGAWFNEEAKVYAGELDFYSVNDISKNPVLMVSAGGNGLVYKIKDGKLMSLEHNDWNIFDKFMKSGHNRPLAYFDLYDNPYPTPSRTNGREAMQKPLDWLKTQM